MAAERKSALLLSRTTWLTIFVIVSLANAWPFAAYDYVPFIDHPSHLLKANVLRHFKNPGLRYFENFKINRVPAPNILGDYLTAAVAVSLPIDVAGRLTVALTVFLLPLSVWFWLARAAPGNESWAAMAWTMVWSRFMFFGNENFCLGACLLFWFWGLLAGWDGRPRVAVVLPYALLATAIYLSHFLVFLLAGLGVVIHAGLSPSHGLRAWLAHAAVLAPGIVLAAVWFSAGGLAGSDAPLAWDFSWRAKVHALALGLRPEPWNRGTLETWWMGFCTALVCFIVYRAAIAWGRGRRFPSLLCLACFVPALMMSEWFLIYIPDQRIWWVVLLASLALVSQPGRMTGLAVWLSGAALAFYTTLGVAHCFELGQQRISFAEGVFARFPKGLRLAYLGNPTFTCAYDLQRCFEYYHIRYGGLGSHHLKGMDKSVRYKRGRPPQPEAAGFGLATLGPWLDAYDAVLILCEARDPVAMQMINTLQQRGFRLHCPPSFALLLHPQYVPRKERLPA